MRAAWPPRLGSARPLPSCQSACRDNTVIPRCIMDAKIQDDPVSPRLAPTGSRGSGVSVSAAPSGHFQFGCPVSMTRARPRRGDPRLARTRLWHGRALPALLPAIAPSTCFIDGPSREQASAEAGKTRARAVVKFSYESPQTFYSAAVASRHIRLSLTGVTGRVGRGGRTLQKLAHTAPRETRRHGHAIQHAASARAGQGRPAARRGSLQGPQLPTLQALL